MLLCVYSTTIHSRISTLMRDTDMEILSVRPSVRHIPETIVLTIIIFHSSFFSQTPNQKSDGIGSLIGIHRHPIELYQF